MFVFDVISISFLICFASRKLSNVHKIVAKTRFVYFHKNEVKQKYKEVISVRTFEQKGSWYYVVDIGRHPVSGKRMQKKKGGFQTQKQAEKAGIKLLADVQNGLVGTTDRLTFGELCDIWINSYPEKRSVKESTMNLKHFYIVVFKRYFDKIDVQKVSRKHIQDALQNMSSKYVEHTLSMMFSFLKALFEKAIELGVIKDNPCKFAYVPKKRKTLDEIESAPIQSRYLEKDALQHFLQTAKKFGMDHDFVFFMLLAYTGLRVGEAMALKWSDIDFDEQTISITKTIHHKQERTLNFYLDTPKTKSSVRTIAVDQKLLDELKRLKTKQKEFRLSKTNVAKFDFVFINYARHAGYPMTYGRIKYRMERLVAIAKLDPSITPHILRHTHTSLLAEAGVGLIEIMERLGHHDDKITREIYLHLTKKLKKEAAQKFAQLMNDL